MNAYTIVGIGIGFVDCTDMNSIFMQGVNVGEERIKSAQDFLLHF